MGAKMCFEILQVGIALLLSLPLHIKTKKAEPKAHHFIGRVYEETHFAEPDGLLQAPNSYTSVSVG